MSSYEFAEELTPQQSHRINFSKFLSNHKLAIKNYTQRIIDRYVELENFRDFFSEPIYLSFEPPEIQRFDEIIQSENEIQKKCLIIFGNLIVEMDYLSQTCRKKYFPQLAVFGEKPEMTDETNSESKEEDEGEIEEEVAELRNKQFQWEMQLVFSRFVDFLCKLWNFVRRCEVVIKNVIQQMGMFFKMRTTKEEFKYFSRVQLHAVMYSLLNLLKNLTMLDCIIEQNEMIKPQFQYYFRMLAEVVKNEKKFGVEKIDIQKLQYLMEKLNTTLLDGRILYNMCFLNFNDLEKELNLQELASFKKTFFINLVQLFNMIIGDKMESKTDKIVGICATYYLYRVLWPDEQLDKKFLKNLFDCHNKIPIVYLYGNTYWTISMFLNKYLPKEVDETIKFPLKEINKFVQKFFSTPFEIKVRKYMNRMSIWYSFVHSSFKSEGSNFMFIKEQQLIQGLTLSYKISSFVRTIIYFSIYNNKALKADRIVLICKLIQILKEIQITIYDLSIKMGKFMSNVIENHTYQIQKYFVAIEKAIQKKKDKITEKDIEELRTVQCCLNVLSGAPTRKRLIASRLAMDFCPKQYFGPKELKTIAEYVKKIRIMSNFRDLLDVSSDCSFLYWNQGISLIFFKYIYQNSERAYQIPLIFLALEDCREILEKAVHIRDRKEELSESLSDLSNKCRIIMEGEKTGESGEEGEKEEEEENKEEEEEEGERDSDVDEDADGLSDLPLPDPSDLPLPPIDDNMSIMDGGDDEPPVFLLEEEEVEGEDDEDPKEKEGENSLIKSYRDSLLKTFDSTILTPLGTEIDQFLRLNVISNDTSNYDPSGRNIKNLEHFFSIRRIRFFGRVVDIGRWIQKFLEKVFYDYTTMQQTDWKIYEEMRNLFYEKYGIRLLDSYLPKQITHQGEDIVDVTKNIMRIVSTYSYNFNNNMFVQIPEKVPDRKLKTLLVRHVSNSIRTHGTGIMNTTVDFVFRYLKEKLFDFSRFLYDEHIHGRLVKDVRFYKEKHLELDNKYPVDRAIDFVIKIKKLGIEEGKTFLDKFRDLITKIGNALGYVRMVRAGGLRHVHSAVRYVPTLEEIPNFKELLEKEEGFSHYTKNCGSTLYGVLENYTTRFEQGSDYFVKLEEAFSKLLNTSEYKHLDSFYMIIPPLTISFVEDMIYGKEQMDRRSRHSKFTNDGFSLGISFVLKVLKQRQIFGSLNWFKSCAKHYQSEASVEENSSTLTRAKVYLKEFQLLFHAFNCTKIFLY